MQTKEKQVGKEKHTKKVKTQMLMFGQTQMFFVKDCTSFENAFERRERLRHFLTCSVKRKPFRTQNSLSSSQCCCCSPGPDLPRHNLLTQSPSSAQHSRKVTNPPVQLGVRVRGLTLDTNLPLHSPGTHPAAAVLPRYKRGKQKGPAPAEITLCER